MTPASKPRDTQAGTAIVDSVTRPRRPGRYLLTAAGLSPVP
jgi:hypothetical protein